MTEDNEERIVNALEIMSNALNSMARTYELLYYKMYPPPRRTRDIQMTKPWTEEEKLRADQGATGEPTTKDWMTLDAEEEQMGPREREGAAAERKKAADAGREDEVRSGPSQRRSEEA